MSAVGLTWTLNDWCGQCTAEEPNLLSILVHNYYPTMCAPSCVCVHSDMSVAFLTPRRIKNICNRQLCMQYWNVNLQQTIHSRRILVPFPPHKHMHSLTPPSVFIPSSVWILLTIDGNKTPTIKSRLGSWVLSPPRTVSSNGDCGSESGVGEGWEWSGGGVRAAMLQRAAVWHCCFHCSQPTMDVFVRLLALRLVGRYL